MLGVALDSLDDCPLLPQLPPISLASFFVCLAIHPLPGRKALGIGFWLLSALFLLMHLGQPWSYFVRMAFNLNKHINCKIRWLIFPLLPCNSLIYSDIFCPVKDTFHRYGRYTFKLQLFSVRNHPDNKILFRAILARNASSISLINFNLELNCWITSAWKRWNYLTVHVPWLSDAPRETH